MDLTNPGNNLPMLEVLTTRSMADNTPSVLEVWAHLEGDEIELRHLLVGASETLRTATSTRERIDILIGLLEVGKDIGYYGALDDVGRKGGAPC